MNRLSLQRTSPDEQLAAAIRIATSWRGVMRELGLKSHSGQAIAAVRRRAVELGLDTSHFRGARRWSDAQLRSAISSARTWDEVIEELGLSANSGNIRPFLKSHAVRLGIDYGHLASRSATMSSGPGEPGLTDLTPGQDHLREAAASIAAAWFALSGCPVSVPLEPAIYDLLVEMPDGVKRIQVKSTTYESKDGWTVTVGRRPYTPRDLGPLAPYELGTIDFFFIVDGDLSIYLIPATALAGAVRVSLRTYRHYIIGSAHGFGSLECQTV